MGFGGAPAARAISTAVSTACSSWCRTSARISTTLDKSWGQRHWPYAPGEVLLGEPVLVRRKHSISSAAEEIGVGQNLVRQFLIEAGAIAQDGPRPDARLVFDAVQHKALLSEIPTLVGPIAMQDAMGATKMELIGLEEEGLLVPRTRIPSVKNVRRIADGHDLLTKLLARAVTISADDADWETLLLARRRTDMGLAKMMDAIDAGSLDVGARQALRAFMASSFGWDRSRH